MARRTPPDGKPAGDRRPRCLERAVRPAARPWLGRLFAASILRQAGITNGTHLVAIAYGLIADAEFGLKKHDRLALARTLFQRKLEGQRTSSKLPDMVGLVMTKPLVSAGMVVKTLNVTPQAALRIVLELGLREMTGRGRFWVWDVI